MSRKREPIFDANFLARQQEYYNARAAEYHEWWERRGRYDHGPEANAQWFRERQEVDDALDVFRLTGHVLELACGSGNWTGRLVRTAATVTAVDGSAEMLTLNAARLRAEGLREDVVRYVQADLFAWEPEQRFDGVFFGFWLSHVPPERLSAFWEKARRALKAEGKLFFVDSRKDPLTTTVDQPLPEQDQPWLVRKLNDGREFPIVKVFYTPEQLIQEGRRVGLRISMCSTDRFFLYGMGHVAADEFSNTD